MLKIWKELLNNVCHSNVSHSVMCSCKILIGDEELKIMLQQLDQMVAELKKDFKGIRLDMWENHLNVQIDSTWIFAMIWNHDFLCVMFDMIPMDWLHF